MLDRNDRDELSVSSVCAELKHVGRLTKLADRT
jgi:hypothetical protein